MTTKGLSRKKVIISMKSNNSDIVKIVDGGLCSFLFSLFYLIFLFLLFSIFYFQNNSGQGLSVTPSHQSQIDGVVTGLITGLERMKQKVLEQSDVIQHGPTCWPHVILMVIQGRVYSRQHGPWAIVYKVDYFVLGTLSSSLVLLNTRVVLLLDSLSLKS